LLIIVIIPTTNFSLTAPCKLGMNVPVVTASEVKRVQLGPNIIQRKRLGGSGPGMG
jgi:hypothetical protein